MTAESFTRFSAKSRSTLIFNFRTTEKEIGSIFSFSAQFVLFEAGKASRFSAGISNIELR